ncbi:hypothetical protein [Aporhodopirellula aestuarii]|uniref:Uncharacterized protein n=1 Tax=Aporhodopirellula aestuarii TaxID=2950107 RepID=A0ABT0U582_9BACT|nr:hypothetical protein [Aporhodopirellula aestuarii]MCM2372072.1 hypothetical protein [Aporhodopirellula aestuarii]
MWHTSDGDRTLVDDEAILVRSAIDSLVDHLLDRLNHESRDREQVASQRFDFEIGVYLFDVLTPNQQIGLLHTVAKYLLEPTDDVLELTAASESAVAAIYAHALRQIEIEIEISEFALSDSPRSEFDQEAATEALLDPVHADFLDFDALSSGFSQFAYETDPFYWRRLARNAYTGAGEFELVNEAADVDMGPDLHCTDIEQWRFLVDCLCDWVLWDRDFEMAACFLDADPARASETRSIMGIEDDYFTCIVRDPKTAEIPNLVSATRDIVRRKPR